MIFTLEEAQQLLSHKCVDCGVETCPINWVRPDDAPGNYKFSVSRNSQENFLLWDEVWAEIGLPSDGGALCVGCIEKRLGRKLELSDFDFGDDPQVSGNGYNHPDQSTKRLLSRMLPRDVRRLVLSGNRGQPPMIMRFRSEWFSKEAGA